MCTVTFFPVDGKGYMLAMNRDESRKRATAFPPAVGKSNGIRFIRPVDGDEKGTWIGINENKLAFCLVNWFQAYSRDDSDRHFKTRGGIIPGLMSYGSIAECDSRLSEIDLRQYRPFRLLGFQADPLRVMQWRWNGAMLNHKTESLQPNIWTSSGYDADGVHRSRRKVFEQFLESHPAPTPQQLRDLHASTKPEKGAYSIAMWHEKAYSVSTTIIDATQNPILMYYVDGYPPDSVDMNRFSL